MSLLKKPQLSIGFQPQTNGFIDRLKIILSSILIFSLLLWYMGKAYKEDHAWSWGSILSNVFYLGVGVLLLELLNRRLSVLTSKLSKPNSFFYLLTVDVAFFLVLQTIILFILEQPKNALALIITYSLNGMLTILYVFTYYLTETKGKRSNGIKYEKSSLHEEEMKQIVKAIDSYLNSNQTFLKRNLTIKEVADQLNLPSYKISQSLSVYTGRNFNDLLNTYRIKFSEKLLTNSDYDHYKVEAIAIESGFNNKVTFYKAFTKIHGMTPSEFRRTRSNG